LEAGSLNTMENVDIAGYEIKSDDALSVFA
jgi:hypothetical protein